jgi:predicted nucleic acid-binding protein
VTVLLLDTSPVIDLQHEDKVMWAYFDEAVANRTRLWGTPVLIAEFYSGVLLGEHPRVDELLSLLRYVSITPGIGHQSARYRYDFARRGIQLQTADTLVAACARSIGADLLTSNLKDFPMTDIRVLGVPRA